MADDNGMSGLGWFLAGLGIGALVGVLYAPKAGTDTRQDVLNAAADAKEKAAALAQQGLDKANEYVDQGKQAAGDYVDKGKEYYEKGRSQWTQYVEKGKSLVSDQQAAVQAAIDAGKEAYTSKAGESTEAAS
jgi:gas vesicle protein